MIIKKIFNNNAVLAKDNAKREVVLMGCGIAFKKSIGENVDEDLIDKTFILKQKEASERFKMLLEDIPMEYVSLCYNIIEYAKGILHKELNDYIYITLTDHIYYTLKIFKEGILRPNILLWEIKKFYAKEYQVGIKALEFILDEMGIDLPKEEAANIALHLVNAQLEGSTDKIADAVSLTKKVGDILNIVKYAYQIELNENSLDYERFVTHLRFFFQRLNRQEKYESGDDYVYLQVKEKYPDTYQCMKRIMKYLDTDLNCDEQLYLMLHIHRVTAG